MDHLPDIEEADDQNEDLTPKVSAPRVAADAGNVYEAPAPDIKENGDESRPFGTGSHTLAYNRSLDDTTVSEMTMPTVFQTRPTVESPVEEDSGVLQETSAGNIDFQKSNTQVLTDSEKPKSVPDPFDANSSFFSSGDPFGAAAARSVGTSMSENASSFNDDFFTPLQREPSATSNSQPDFISDTQSNELFGDPPLEVVGMASSDEEDESDKSPRTSTKLKSTRKSHSSKAVKEKGLMNGEATSPTKKTEVVVDDPPLEVVDMNSSDDEAPNSDAIVSRKEPGHRQLPGKAEAMSGEKAFNIKGIPSRRGTEAAASSPIAKSNFGNSLSKDGIRHSAFAGIALESPPNPVLTRLKERKMLQRKPQQTNAREMEASVPSDVAITTNRPHPDEQVSTRVIPEGRSESYSVPGSSSSRQMPPAAEAAGRSSSQRARILAKHRRNRNDSDSAVAPEHPYMINRDKSNDDVCADGQNSKRDDGLTSRKAASVTRSATAIPRQIEATRGAIRATSTGKNLLRKAPDQEEKTTAPSQSNKSQATNPLPSRDLDLF